MTLCAFCHTKLLSNPRWMPGQPLIHHVYLEEWKHSVESACVFCTLLMEHVKAAVESVAMAQEASSKAKSAGGGSPSPQWVPIKPDPERDARVRNNTVEQLLLDWVAEREETLRKALPLFEAVLQDGGAGNAWYLKFQPVQKNSTHDDYLALPSQRFSVYASEYDRVSDQDVRLEGNTKSEATISAIRSWIKGCEKHRHCGHLHRVPAETEYVPTRLLDVGGPGEHYLRLVETGNSNVKKYRPYVTLSYKWGYDANCLLTADNRKEYLREISLSKLTPATFRDAVSVARSLGVRYLWIDALCMLQNDPEEWLRESPMMQEIYYNSFIGLAAVSADNCDQGLFRERTGAGATPCDADVTWAHQSLQCRVMRDDFWKGEILSEPLYKRGWVLQERMLAPRILHFQRRQVFWQCPSLTACESVPSGLSTIVDDERRDEMHWRRLFHRAQLDFSWEQEVDMHGIWRFVVQHFTKCDLTKSRDKLMAIAGIAKQMKVAFKEQYIAGMWKRDLVEQLAWRVTQFPQREAENWYRAPSWAWPSVDGVVEIPARLKHERDYVMTIQENGVHLVLEKPKVECGTLYFGSLTAEVELYRLTFVAPCADGSTWKWETASGEGRHAWCRLFPDVPFRREDFYHRVSVTENQADDVSVQMVQSDDAGGCEFQVVCTAAMLLYGRDFGAAFSGYALALRPAQAGQANAFLRIGLIQFRHLIGPTWTALRHARKPKTTTPGQQIAASDNRSAWSHIVTVL